MKWIITLIVTLIGLYGCSDPYTIEVVCTHDCGADADIENMDSELSEVYHDVDIEDIKDVFVEEDSFGDSDTCYCDDHNMCTADSCDEDGCVFTVITGGMCTKDGELGQCMWGICCTGCYVDNACLNGTSVYTCGITGTLCQACDDDNECTEDICGPPCQYLDEPRNGTACRGGVCLDGACEPCGGIGQPCCENDTCQGSMCVSGTCEPCGGIGQPCCDTGVICDSGIIPTVCNIADNRCVECGDRGETCCAGFSCGVHLACESNRCLCGGMGQPCCAGHYCDGSLYCMSYGLCE